MGGVTWTIVDCYIWVQGTRPIFWKGTQRPSTGVETMAVFYPGGWLIGEPFTGFLSKWFLVVLWAWPLCGTDRGSGQLDMH